MKSTARHSTTLKTRTTRRPRMPRSYNAADYEKTLRAIQQTTFEDVQSVRTALAQLMAEQKGGLPHVKRFLRDESKTRLAKARRKTPQWRYQHFSAENHLANFLKALCQVLKGLEQLTYQTENPTDLQACYQQLTRLLTEKVSQKSVIALLSRRFAAAFKTSQLDQLHNVPAYSVFFTLLKRFPNLSQTFFKTLGAKAREVRQQRSQLFQHFLKALERNSDYDIFAEASPRMCFVRAVASDPSTVAYHLFRINCRQLPDSIKRWMNRQNIRVVELASDRIPRRVICKQLVDTITDATPLTEVNYFHYLVRHSSTTEWSTFFIKAIAYLRENAALAQAKANDYPLLFLLSALRKAFLAEHSHFLTNDCYPDYARNFLSKLDLALETEATGIAPSEAISEPITWLALILTHGAPGQGPTLVAQARQHIDELRPIRRFRMFRRTDSQPNAAKFTELPVVQAPDEILYRIPSRMHSFSG